ncbi:MAG: cartilage oligomeric matrix protein [Nevskia sp.]|nr:cartilage oligomeric matrix protein [Nevskia sp.]
MNYAHIMKPLIRLLALTVVGSAALLTSGCANGPGNGTSTGGTTSGATGGSTSGVTGGATGGATGGTTGGNGSCTNAATCPVVTVLLDGKANDALADATAAAQATWTSTNTNQTTGSKPCTPSGGLGTATDPWTHSGPFAFQSPGYPDQAQGLTEQPVQNGVYTFVLTCLNPAGDGASTGTATLTVGNGSTNPSPINVTVTATPPTINFGDSATITWSALDANGTSDTSIVCAHTSSPADAVWNSAPTAASGSVLVTPTSAVVYTYVLTCRNAAGGSGAGAVALSVNDANNPPLVQCPAGQQFVPFRNTGDGEDIYVAAATIKPLCLGCSVAPNPPSNLVSAINTAGTPAVINDLIGLLIDGVSITITDLINVHTPDPILGNTVGFIISKPGAPLLSLDLLRSVTLRTLNNGTVVQSASGSQLLLLDLLTLNADPSLKAVVFNARQPFRSIQLSVGGIADVLSTTNVYEAGACLAPGTSSGGTTGSTP